MRIACLVRAKASKDADTRLKKAMVARGQWHSSVETAVTEGRLWAVQGGCSRYAQRL